MEEARLAKGAGSSLEHAATHAAHTAHTTHAAGSSRALLLRGLNDGNLGGTEQGGDTAGIEQSGANDLERIEDTAGDHVDVLALGAVETAVEVLGELVGQLADNDAALEAGVLNNGASGAGDGVLDDADTELLVEVLGLDIVKAVGGGLEKGGTTTGEDTLLNSSTGSVESIDNTVLLLTDLNLGGTTDLDDGNTARELGQTLLELLLLVFRGAGVRHDTADLLAALGNGVLAALTVQDDGILLGDGDGAGGTKHVGGELLELDVELISEDGTVGKDGKIAKDALAVVTESGSLDGSDLQLATELVQNADGESLTLNVLGDDDQGAAEGGGGLKGGDDVLNGRDLLLRQQNQGLLELNLLGLGIGDEVGGGVSTVEAHTLSDLQLILNGLALLDSDDTLLADTLHGGGDQLTDVGVTVGGDSSNLSDLLTGGNVTLVLLEVVDDSINSSLDTTAQIHGVAASSNVLHGLREDGTGKDGSGGGTVTSNLVGLRSDILEEASTEVLELVLESDGLGNRDTIYFSQYTIRFHYR
ncbi:hypothetical protein GB937_004732 [Aspergillus fischeri]|nr:hypothetical protein GB937_004732 [Aspergillus fischeri]